MGIEDGTLLGLTLLDGEIRLRPVTPEEAANAGSPWLRELWEYFAPARQEALARGYTDEQINVWIDEAVAAYRREQGG